MAEDKFLLQKKEKKKICNQTN